RMDLTRIAQLSVAALAALASMTNVLCSAARLPLEQIKLPKGFAISIYAENVPDARSMALAPDGTVFVGNKDRDKVYAIVNRQPAVIASGLRVPNGVAFRDGALYVAEVNRVLRFDHVIDWLKQPAGGRSAIKPVVVS